MRRKHPMPPGPWNDEPSLVQFEHQGFHCAIVRNLELGTLNGYVAVPEGHPWYRTVDTHASGPDVSTHGGVTFAEASPPPGVETGREPLWWVGFDTAHNGDFVPVVSYLCGRTEPRHGEVYKTYAYVRREVEQLAEQAAAAS